MAKSKRAEGIHLTELLLLSDTETILPKGLSLVETIGFATFLFSSRAWG